VALEFQNVVRYYRQGGEQPRNAEYPEIGNDGQPPFRQEYRDKIADHGNQSQHDREDDEVRHDGYLTGALPHLVRVVLQLREGGEGDGLYGTDYRADGHVLVLFAAVVVAEGGFGVHPSDEQFGSVGIDGVGDVAEQQARAVSQHRPQGAERDAAAGAPVAARPQQERFDRRCEQPLAEQRPDSATGGGHAYGGAAPRQRCPQLILGEGFEIETPREDGILNVGERIDRHEQEEHRGEGKHYRRVVIAGQERSNGEQDEVQGACGEDVEEEIRRKLFQPDLLFPYQRRRKSAVHEHRTY